MVKPAKQTGQAVVDAGIVSFPDWRAAGPQRVDAVPNGI